MVTNMWGGVGGDQMTVVGAVPSVAQAAASWSGSETAIDKMGPPVTSNDFVENELEWQAQVNGDNTKMDRFKAYSFTFTPMIQVQV